MLGGTRNDARNRASNQARYTLSRHAAPFCPSFRRSNQASGTSGHLDARGRIQSGRANSVADGTADRDVRKLLARRSAAQKQPPAAHVAAADEGIREEQPVTEDRLQHVHVLRATRCCRGGRPGSRARCRSRAHARSARGAFDTSGCRSRRRRPANPLIASSEIDVSGDRSPAFGVMTNTPRPQISPAPSGTEANAVGISELPAEVQAAQKREHFSERRPPLVAQPRSELEPRTLRHDDLSAPAAAVRRR